MTEKVFCFTARMFTNVLVFVKRCFVLQRKISLNATNGTIKLTPPLMLQKYFNPENNCIYILKQAKKTVRTGMHELVCAANELQQILNIFKIILKYYIRNTL